jgi:type II secretory pathway component PulF
MLPLGLFSMFKWDIPFLDVLFKRRHSILVLRSLGLTTEGGKPIVEGLETLARVYPSRWVQGRLVAVLREVQQGGDWVESLADHALIRASDEAVLSSAQRAGNLAWALGEMADVNERRLGYRLQLWLQFLFPVLLTAIGVLVLVMAVAYFSPIVRLIQALSG